MNEKDNKIENLMQEKEERENEVLNYKSLIQKLEKQKDLSEPTWEELKSFILLDKTNELIYNNESFDCSGFTIELFKKARILGFKVGIVELEFENSSVGHTLNIFKTQDRGIVYIDVTGNENGTGFDKLAYVKKGKPYVTVALGKVKEDFVNCNLDCRSLVNSELERKEFNITDYEFFDNAIKCFNLLNSCIPEYNNEAEKFNRGTSSYSYVELSKWKKNLEILKNEITVDNKLIISKGSVIKNVQIYW